MNLDTEVGGWYLFKDHTIIRVCGSKLKPYLLHVFWTPIIFLLEYIRQRLNSNYICFGSKNQKNTFKFPTKVFSLVVKTNAYITIVERMLAYLNIKGGNIWIYDPYHIISSMTCIAKSSPYLHQTDFEIEKFPNKDSWGEVQDILQGHHVQVVK